MAGEIQLPPHVMVIEECLVAITFYDDFYFARRFALRRPDLLAIIEIESGFNTNAYRFEKSLNEGSYGLMQVMLSTATDRGFKGDPSRLFKPDLGIYYGMRQIDWLCDELLAHSRNQWRDVIRSYNEGIGNDLKGRADPQYVAKFEAARKRYVRFS